MEGHKLNELKWIGPPVQGKCEVSTFIEDYEFFMHKRGISPYGFLCNQAIIAGRDIYCNWTYKKCETYQDIKNREETKEFVSLLNEHFENQRVVV
jgi:hypothetical protein